MMCKGASEGQLRSALDAQIAKSEEVGTAADGFTISKQVE